MNMKEEQLLQKVFWPTQKEEILGNMIFSYTDESFTKTTEVSVSRQDKAIEVAYSAAEVFNPEEKEYFVKLFLIKDSENNLTVDRKKSSPEIHSDEDAQQVLETVSNAILKMNTLPNFFPTGVVKKPENKMKLN